MVVSFYLKRLNRVRPGRLSYNGEDERREQAWVPLTLIQLVHFYFFHFK